MAGKDYSLTVLRVPNKTVYTYLEQWSKKRSVLGLYTGLVFKVDFFGLAQPW